eukprot:g16591.t1
MEKGSDPKVFFADILSREMNLKAIGVEIPEAEMVQLILRQLSDDFDVEKRTLFVTDPEISRVVLEQRISAAYSVRKANSLGKQPTAAAPAATNDPAAKSNPHALAVGQGDGFRQGGHSGFGRHPGGGGGIWGRGPPSSAQQQQWSRGGGAPQQQQWSRGGGGYAYANVVSVPNAERPSTPVPAAAPGGFVDDRGYFTPDPCGGPGSAPLRNAGGDGGYEETSVGPVEQQSEPASEERRVTFQEDPGADEGGVVYEEEDPGEWNAAVEAQNRGEDPFGQHFAAALSLPCGAATAGRDGDVFHPGFMALRPVSEGPCVDEGSDGPSVDNEVRGGAPESSAGGAEDVGAATGSVGGSSGAKEPAPTDGDSGREAAVPGTADHEAESGGSLGPPPLPPEMEWVPPLVHQSPDEQLPPGAKLYKGRVYRAEPRQTRAQTRAASAAAATAGGASDAATTGEERYALVDRVGITAALVLQFGGTVLPETKERCEEAETKERCEEARATRRTPGMFTIRRSQEDILRAVYDEPAPDISPDDLPAVPVHELAAPLTVEEALSGPYAKLWKHAMRGELGGHLDTGTFEQLDANS